MPTVYTPYTPRIHPSHKIIMRLLIAFISLIIEVHP